MRVIRVAEVVRPAVGGIRAHVTSLLSHLAPDEFAPTLFAPRDFTLLPGSGTVQVPTAIRARTSPLHDLAAIVTLALRLRGRFDLVHAHGLRGALIGVSAARMARIPAVFTAHNLISPAGAAAAATLRFLGRSAVAIAVSQAVAASLTTHGLDPGRIHVIGNGVDTQAFACAPIDEARRREVIAGILESSIWTSAPSMASWLRSSPYSPRTLAVIGAVGRLAPEKGFDLLIRAFAKLSAAAAEHPDEAALLVIAGAGPEQQRLITLAHSVPNVALAGALADVAPLLCSVDMVAVPSREEGQGIVALEAMAAGRPVVAYRVGGLPESIVSGETGLLVPAEDTDALAAALGKLAASPELRSRMGTLGRARAAGLFTVERMAQRTAALYRTLAEERGRQRR